MNKKVLMAVIDKKKDLIRTIYQERSRPARLALLMTANEQFGKYVDYELKQYSKKGSR